MSKKKKEKKLPMPLTVDMIPYLVRGDKAETKAQAGDTCYLHYWNTNHLTDISTKDYVECLVENREMEDYRDCPVKYAVTIRRFFGDIRHKPEEVRDESIWLYRPAEVMQEDKPVTSECSTLPTPFSEPNPETKTEDTEVEPDKPVKEPMKIVTLCREMIPDLIWGDKLHNTPAVGETCYTNVWITPEKVGDDSELTKLAVSSFSTYVIYEVLGEKVKLGRYESFGYKVGSYTIHISGLLFFRPTKEHVNLADNIKYYYDKYTVAEHGPLSIYTTLELLEEVQKRVAAQENSEVTYLSFPNIQR